MDKNYLTTSEVAKILDVSRIAVFKKIKLGHIKAVKSGRNFIIDKKDLPDILGATLTPKKKKEITNLIKTKGELSVPATIFLRELGALEALVKYMKENLMMSYHEISELLNRDDRTIWTAYKKALEKQPENIKVEKTKMYLPISIFRNRELTVLESTIIYLKYQELKYSEIARLLNRDQRNIWVIYSRTLKKRNI